MKTHLRIGISSQSSGFLWALLCAACGLAACTTTAVKSDAGPGGSGGTTGSPGGTTGGTGGSGGGMYVLVDGTLCLPPAASGLITDFTYVTPDAAVTSDAAADGGGTATVADQIHFGDDTTTLSGGVYYYPNPSSTATPVAYQLHSDVTGSNWHITGMVGDYSGLGFYYDNCNKIDASAFKGISFTISGTVQGSAVTVEVDTLNDTIAASWLNTHMGTADVTAPGHCIPGPTAVNQYAQSDCVEPTKLITVPATPGTVSVLWSDFTTGKPEAAVTPSQIVGIRWGFPNPVGVATPSVVAYPLDVVIDNIAFIPK